ncbi:hypothetical protein RhiirA1_483693 [Rhizophagus irregularis]|uniref:BED-type domain-containing protein n=1 Tax=Rhizophagus irregularis TaxID=588596 RepID=A0A2N0QK85_9GLOM|nr:hypothetical protein RhiirA1_483693 [Rhizophagus irregularis]
MSGRFIPVPVNNPYNGNAPINTEPEFLNWLQGKYRDVMVGTNQAFCIIISNMSLEMRIDTETSEKSRSNIWKYFTKERGQDNKITAKCNYCNAKYVVVKGATTNLWIHIKKIHVSLLGLSTTQHTLEQFGLSINSNSEIFTGVIN